MATTRTASTLAALARRLPASLAAALRSTRRAHCTRERRLGHDLSRQPRLARASSRTSAPGRSATAATPAPTAPRHVVLPAWYGPGNNPPLPLVISPHGRGATGRSNADFFGRLPAVGRFAVISPDGMGAAAEELLLRRARPDRRPRADARARRRGAAVAADRPLADLRAREQHGRPGDAAARRPAPSAARRRRRARLRHRPRAPLPPAAAAPLCAELRGALGQAVRHRPPVHARAARSAARPQERARALRRAERAQPGPRRSRAPACRSRSGGAPRTGSCGIRSTSRRRSTTSCAGSTAARP